jgi:ribosome maturation factor RimP
MDNRVLESQIRDLVAPTVERLGFDLVAVEWIGGRGAATVRVSIDRPVGVRGGISADDCGEVSARISPILDEADPVDGAWHLEVSSPGIERPVQRAEDFARFVGYRARIRASAGAQRRRCTGVIQSIEGDPPSVTVVVDGVDVVLPLDLIERAHLVLSLEEFQQLAEESGHDE